MPIARTVFMQTPDRFSDDVSQAHGTVGVVSQLHQPGCNARHFALAAFLHERIDKALHGLSSAPECHRTFVVTTECFQAEQQMRLAPLEDPSVLLGNTPGTAKTIGNKGHNAVPGLLWDQGDDLSPPLLRLVTVSQDRTQEMEIVSVHRPQTEQVHGVHSLVLAKPHRIHDEDESTGWRLMWPGAVGEDGERRGVTFRKGAYA